MTLTFSIVTPTLNRRAMLAEAVESVRAQAWPHLQHIVVDGGSTDGSLEWIAAQSDLTLVTGPDRGVYNAMNKGIRVARGDLIGLLNSDDLYLPGTFQGVATEFRRNPTSAAVAGGALLMAEGRVVRRLSDEVALAPDDRACLLGVCLPNNRFFKPIVFGTIGEFNAEWCLVADRDLMLRFNSAGLRTVGIDREIYVYRQHDGSLTMDLERKRAVGLRGELMSLASHWKGLPTATPEQRHLARILEGRSRIGLIRDSAGGLSAREIWRLIGTDKGRPSIAAPASIIASIIDLLVS